MVSLLLTINALICVALIILILLQRSDPASGGMFGGTGGGGGGAVIRNPLAKPTSFLALAFLILSLTIAYLNKGAGHEPSIMTDAIHAPAPAAVSPSLPAPTLLPGAPTASSPTAQ